MCKSKLDLFLIALLLPASDACGIHGCCRDGVTPAKGPGYYGCPTSREFKEPECEKAAERGVCTNFTVRWAYDVDQERCQTFWYGGCHGNGNNFATEKDCEANCKGLGKEGRPTVQVEIQRITIAKGEAARIKCQADGNPSPSIKWLKSRGRLGPGIQVQSGSLVIRNATVVNRGIYICRAENIVGVDEDFVVIDVY